MVHSPAMAVHLGRPSLSLECSRQYFSPKEVGIGQRGSAVYVTKLGKTYKSMPLYYLCTHPIPFLF